MDSATTKFQKQHSITISRALAILLLVIFVVCLVTTGLLVYNFSSRTNFSKIEEFIAPDCGNIDEISTEETQISEDLFPVNTVSATTTTSTETAKTEPELDVRLPRSIIPHSYKLKLIPFIQEGNFTYNGEVEIFLNVTENTKNITLHVDDLIIDSVRVFDLNNNTKSIKQLRNDTKKQFFIIYLEEEVLKNQHYYLYITFRGVLNDLLQGFYRSSYTENNVTRWIAASQFQATDARRAFPCFDEPGLKAKFQISIARLKSMSSISNMNKIGEESVEGLPDYVWDHFGESVPMSTYLVAFVVSDFQKISNGSFSIWARPSALSQAKYSLKIGPAILKYYEQFFGIKYPLPKLDMVAIPDFSAGAMENWGLITFRESVLLYEEGVSSKAMVQTIAHVVAHELAHQWFGNLVTPTWWTDLWLNEGFATYVEYLGANAVEPEWKHKDFFVYNELHKSFGLDAMKSSHQISVKVNNPDEVNEMFDRISYSKGASIIRMMQHFLTDSVFHKGLHKYLMNRLYGNAEQDDLWSTLTEQSHEDGVLSKKITVKEIMDTWTLQVGFPLVTATRNYETGQVNIKQEKFSIDKDNARSDVLWWIPVSYISENESYQLSWMCMEQQITLTPHIQEQEWLLLNVNQTGYYRVNYDETNWKLLIKQLNKKNGHLVFDPKNRAQLIDDALNLAYSGYLNYSIALNITLYLKQEREYLPWKVALDNMEYLQYIFVRTGQFEKYKNYMLYLIRDFYEDIKNRVWDDRDPLSMLTQIEIMKLACDLGLRDCIIKAVQQFQNWKNSVNPDLYNSIPPDFRENVYCVAIRDGGEEEWNFAWQRYLNTNVASEQDTLLYGLSCSKEVWILTRFLTWAITENSGIRKHDSSKIFALISENTVGQELAYRFFKLNWSRLRTYLGPSSMFLSSIIQTSTSHFNSELEIDDFKLFMQKRKDEFGIALRSANQSIEEAEAVKKWMENYFNQVTDWLANAIE